MTISSEPIVAVPPQAPFVFAAPEKLDARIALLIFSVAALCAYFPVLLGNFVLGGTDVQFSHYPNLIFGHRAFGAFGELPYWNPYMFLGVDFTKSIHAHYLNPVYWPLALVPERYVFYALSLMFVALNILVAMIWWSIGTTISSNARAAILVGLIAQLSMFGWWVNTTFISHLLYFCSSAAIWLIMTWRERSPKTTFALLSLALAGILSHAHPVYGLAFGLPVCVFAIAWLGPYWRQACVRPIIGTVLLAGFSAIAMTAYRTLPPILSISTEGVHLSYFGLPTYPNHFYTALTVLNPLALGVSIQDNAWLSEALGMQAIRHAQFHNVLYWGIVAFFFVLIALVRKQRHVIKLFLAWLLVSIAPLQMVQGLTDTVFLLSEPLLHEMPYRYGGHVLFLFLVSMALRSYGDFDSEVTNIQLYWLSGPTLGVAVLEVTMWAKALGGSSVGSKLGLERIYESGRISIVALVVAALIYWRVRKAQHVAALCVALATAMMLSIGVVLFYHLGIPRSGLEREIIVSHWAIRVGTVGTFVGALVIAGLACRPLITDRQSVGIIIVFGIVLSLVQAIPPPHVLMTSGPFAALEAAIFGLLAMATIVVTTVFLCDRVRLGNLDRRKALVLFLCLAGLDLLITFRGYSFINTETPFTADLELVLPSARLPDIYGRPRLVSIDEKISGLESLLKNAELSVEAGLLRNWSFGGDGLGRCPADFRPKLLPLCKVTGAGGTLFQDVALSWRPSVVTFGVWLRSEAGVAPQLLLSSPSERIAADAGGVGGDGRWRWITVTLRAASGLPDVRAHVIWPSAGNGEIFSPRLVAAARAEPLETPPGEVDKASQLALEEVIDLVSYRATSLYHLLKLGPNELITGMAEAAETPSYSGVDSDLPRDLIEFIESFEKLEPPYYFRGGLAAVVKNERALDLMGVRYAFAPEAALQIRPNAIPRFAAFRNFEVTASTSGALARLKESAFDPRQTLLVGEAPGAALVSGNPAPLRALMPDIVSPNRIIVPVSADTPRLVLFNDRFSPYWHARWNGQPVNVVRANAIFMAVALPPGEGVLAWEFRPSLFLKLAWLSAATFALVTVCLTPWPLIRRAFARKDARGGWGSQSTKAQMMEFVRFAAIGVTSATVYYGAALALKITGDLSQAVCATVATVAAALVSYLGHTYVTFQVDARPRERGPRFLVSLVAALGLSYFIGLWLGDALHVSPFVTFAVVVVTMAIFNYLLFRFWVFTPTPDGARVEFHAASATRLAGTCLEDKSGHGM